MDAQTYRHAKNNIHQQTRGRINADQPVHLIDCEIVLWATFRLQEFDFSDNVSKHNSENIRLFVYVITRAKMP